MSAARVVRFFAWSDYLCPWCWNASRRLERLAGEYRGRVEIVWMSYLLRPEPGRRRDPERFRRYTESWLRPAAEEDAGDFRVWASDAPPPSHSVPAHCVAKAAAAVSPESFERMHPRLMQAYFHENRDISSFDELRELWEELDLPSSAFEVAHRPETEARVRAEHAEAHRWGAHGVPAMRRADNDAAIVGAHPEALYRRWIERSLERGDGLVEVGSPIEVPAPESAAG